MKVDFDIDGLDQYISLLHELTNVSVTIFNAGISVVTASPKFIGAPDEKLKNFIKRKNDDLNIRIIDDGTAEVSASVCLHGVLIAYTLIGQLYYDENAGSHYNLLRNGRPVYYKHKIRSILSLIELGIQNHVRSIVSTNSGLRADIEKYIAENLSLAISAQTVAAEFGVGVDTVRTLFKIDLHTNLQNYLRKKRMEEAKRLLGDTSLPIAEVAARVGWSERKLTEHFQKYESCSPEEYRTSRQGPA